MPGIRISASAAPIPPRKHRVSSGCFQFAFEIFSWPMDIHNLTINQLKRAVAIKEQLVSLNDELRTLFREAAESGAAPKKKRRMSASAKKKIAAAQKARWVNLRRRNLRETARSAARPKKRSMSRAARAKLSTRMKAAWAARKATEK
jgi:hypothetical protein